MASEKHWGELEVANSWDQGPEPTDQLPNPELNPLLNPTLGRNLGRWAQVYFTSPPEKREEAVGELLRELTNETSGMAASESRSAEKPAHGAKLRLEVSCPSCRHQNEGDQRFCGNCGSPLAAGSARGVHSRGKAFAESHTPVDIALNHTGSDVQWLRERVAIRLEEPEDPAYRRWTYLIVGLGILLAGFAYLQWAAPPHRASTSPPPAVALPAPAPQPQNPHPLRPTEPAQTKGKTLVQEREQEQFPPAGKTRTDQKLSADSSSVPPAQAGLGTVGGAQELLFAQRYLEGRNGPRDTSEAAKLLWKAVAQQNADAALLLADLYTRGDGVPKSCDQARLLLLAALKKGASQAAPRLRSLESSGCR